MGETGAISFRRVIGMNVRSFEQIEFQFRIVKNWIQENKTKWGSLTKHLLALTIQYSIYLEHNQDILWKYITKKKK